MVSLIRPLVYICIVFGAFGLKKAGLFGERDYRVLSLIFTNVTLPVNIIHVFVGFSPDNSLYWLVLIGLAFGLAPIVPMYLIKRKHQTISKGFCMVNVSGCNIGGFALPIIQLFFGATGGVYASMYDLGNAVVMCGGGYAVTASILGVDKGEGSSFLKSVRRFIGRLLSSVSLDVYLLMLVLLLLGVQMPEIVGTVTEPIANANGFVSMFMLGLMFRIDLDTHEKLFDVIHTVIFRVAFGVCLGLLTYYFLPLDEMARKVAAVCMVAPAGSISPIYTEKLGADPSLSSFLNSVTVMISFAVMLLFVFFVF